MKTLDTIKLELPDINDIKLIKLNLKKLENEIIKPKDDKIMELILNGNIKVKSKVRKRKYSFTQNYR